MFRLDALSKASRSMRRFLLSQWLSLFLLFLVLSGGCQYNRPLSVGDSTCPDVTIDAPVALSSDATPVVASETTESLGNNSARLSASAKSSSSFATLAPMAFDTFSASSYQDLPVKTQRQPRAVQGPNFAHDPNYRWLVGTLDYSRIQRQWLLRYTSFDEEDRYGGCVTLIAPDAARYFKRGQMVRVEGTLIDPESRQLLPAFEVQAFRVEKP